MPTSARNWISTDPRRALALLAIGVALAVGGCKTRRLVESAPSLKGLSDQAFLEAALKLNPPANRFVLSGKADVQSPDVNQSFRYRVSMGRDSLWASFSLLGIEGFRVLITPDSFWVLDRLNKCLILGAVADMQRQTPVQFGFADLGLLLLGETALAKAGKAVEGGPNQTRKFGWQNGSLELQAQLNPENGKLTRLQAKRPGTAEETWIEYSDFRPAAAGSLPYFVTVQVKGVKGAPLKATLQHLEVDTAPAQLRFAFNRPPSYVPCKR